MTETTVHVQAANITGDGVDYFINGNIESITISAARAKRVFDELTALREENGRLRERVAALEALVDSVGILCEEMYGAEHLQPFPIDLLPETAQKKMNAVLEAWGTMNELGALLYEQPRAFGVFATAEGGE